MLRRQKSERPAGNRLRRAARLLGNDRADLLCPRPNAVGNRHGRPLAAALEDGKTSTGPAGKQLMAFRREVASRNVINVYWTTSKEMRYRVFD